MRLLPLLLLVACEPAELRLDRLDDRPDEGWATSPSEDWTTTDPTDTFSQWEGARLEILQPAAGELLNWGAVHTFEAIVVAENGDELPVDGVEWGSDLAPNWFETGASFDTDALPIGIHAFTAQAELPNGAVVQHTVGGVKVQHPYGGTYAGLLEVDGTILNFPISCVGAGIVVIDRFGEQGTGTGDCLISLLGADVPLSMIYELEIAADASIGGTVGVDLIGFFTYNFDAEGSLDPSATMSVSFGGEVLLMGPLTGSTTAERISLDAQ